MIELSVCIPLYRAKHIAWLPLESLIRQRKITFDWELIIAEENVGKEVFGQAAVMAYKAALQKVRCIRVKYIQLNKWIPLADKRALLVQNCSEMSKIIAGSPADYYSAPLRLAVAYRIFKENPEVDWIIPPRVIIYDIRTGQTLLRTVEKGRRRNDVIGSTLRAQLLRDALPDIKGAKKGVDAIVWGKCQKAKGSPINLHIERSGNWEHALNTSGLNNMTRRAKIFRNPTKIYEKFDRPLRRIIPPPVAAKLVTAKSLIKRHRRTKLGRD